MLPPCGARLHDDAAAVRARKTATAIAYARAQVGKPYRHLTDV
ncbi:hypothetical protein [Dactylosporangium sp. NPDC049140]